MNKATLRMSLLSVFVAFGGGDAEAGQDRFYVYQNCADQGIGPPLTRCSQIRISENLASVYRNDTFEEGITMPAAPGFRAVNSFLVPIAVPEEYGPATTWVHGKYKYVKVGNAHAALYADEPVDTIVVVGNLDKIKNLDAVDSLHNVELLDNGVASFWYSNRKGVLAIGFPKSGDSGEVYYCVSSSCLFAPAPR